MTRVVLVVPVGFVFNLGLDEASARAHANVGSRFRLPRSEPRTSCFGNRRQAAAPLDWRSGQEQSERLTPAFQSILEVWGSGAS